MLLDDLMNYQWSLPHIAPHDLHVFDKDELLEGADGNPMMVGDTVESKCGVRFVVDAFLDVAAVGTYAISEEDGVFFFTSEIVKVNTTNQ